MESLYETFQQIMVPDEPDPVSKDIFIHPIHYSEIVHPVPDTLSSDIQLEPILDEDTNGVYDVLLSPQTIFAKKSAKTWHTHYTTDTTYLCDTQKVLKQMNSVRDTFNGDVRENDIQMKFIESWNRIGDQDTNSFIDMYHYISPNPLRPLNKSSTILQAVNLYVMVSPVLNIAVARHPNQCIDIYRCIEEYNITSSRWANFL